MRRLRLTFASSLMVAAGVACGAFSGSAADPAADGGTEAPSNGDGGVPGADASEGTSRDAEVEGATLLGTCPPAGPICTPPSCTLRTLYVPVAPGYPFQIATDSTHVFWVEQPKSSVADGYNGNAPARILRVPIAGPPTATELAVNQASATALARLGPHVYWATWNGTNTSTLHRTLAACAAGSCAVEDVGSINSRIGKLLAAGSSALVSLGSDGKVVRFPVDAMGVVGAGQVVASNASLPGFALTSTHIYSSSLLQKNVSRATIDGLTKQPNWTSFSFDGGDVGIGNLATDCTYLYGTRSPGVTVVRVSLATGAVSALATLGDKAVYDLAADEHYVYVASLNGGGIVAIDSATGTLVPIDVGASSFFIAVDSAGVYWGDHASSSGNGGTITMMEKAK